MGFPPISDLWPNILPEKDRLDGRLKFLEKPILIFYVRAESLRFIFRIYFVDPKITEPWLNGVEPQRLAKFLEAASKISRKPVSCLPLSKGTVLAVNKVFDFLRPFFSPFGGAGSGRLVGWLKILLREGITYKLLFVAHDPNRGRTLSDSESPWESGTIELPRLGGRCIRRELRLGRGDGSFLS